MNLGHLAVRVAKRGDHLRVWRGSYWHHGIYVGHGWIVEFGRGILGGDVRFVDHATFADGAVMELVRHSDARHPEDIALTAEFHVGHAGFNVLSANCEHFATWCATGRWESKQVQVAGALALVAAIALISVASRRWLAQAA